jgi:hypothetical protein
MDDRKYSGVSRLKRVVKPLQQGEYEELSARAEEVNTHYVCPYPCRTTNSTGPAPQIIEGISNNVMEHQRCTSARCLAQFAPAAASTPTLVWLPQTASSFLATDLSSVTSHTPQMAHNCFGSARNAHFRRLRDIHETVDKTNYGIEVNVTRHGKRPQILVFILMSKDSMIYGKIKRYCECRLRFPLSASSTPTFKRLKLSTSQMS